MTLLTAALPEFLGSLSATVLITGGTWVGRRLRKQRPPRDRRTGTSVNTGS